MLSLISFGQTASHSPSFEQLPKPRSSMRSTMRETRRVCSTWPCGSTPMWVTLAETKRMAEAFFQAATQAPQPMQAAASIARSAVSRGMRMALASGAPPTLTDV